MAPRRGGPFGSSRQAAHANNSGSGLETPGSRAALRALGGGRGSACGASGICGAIGGPGGKAAAAPPPRRLPPLCRSATATRRTNCAGTLRVEPSRSRTSIEFDAASKFTNFAGRDPWLEEALPVGGRTSSAQPMGQDAYRTATAPPKPRSCICNASRESAARCRASVKRRSGERSSPAPSAAAAEPTAGPKALLVDVDASELLSAGLLDNEDDARLDELRLTLAGVAVDGVGALSCRALLDCTGGRSRVTVTTSSASLAAYRRCGEWSHEAAAPGDATPGDAAPGDAAPSGAPPQATRCCAACRWTPRGRGAIAMLLADSDEGPCDGEAGTLLDLLPIAPPPRRRAAPLATSAGGGR